MMNILYEDFPYSVLVNGKTYMINTDFREWIRFVGMLKSDELTSAEKMQIAMMYYLPDIPDDNIAAMNALVDFFEMRALLPYHTDKDDDAAAHRKNVLSYEADGKYIYAAFLHDYGIDLQKESMHWWRFRILFDGLGDDNEIKKRIYYRSINVSDIKDKNEKSRILKIQRQIALPQDVLSDYEIGNAFA